MSEIRYTTDPRELTLAFHLTTDEIKKATELVKARGITRLTPAEEVFPVMLQVLDQMIPGARLVEKAKAGEVIALVSFPPEQMTDSRFNRLKEIGAEAPAPEAGEQVMTLALARVSPTSSIGGKLAALEMVPLPEDLIEQLRSRANGQPHPTHKAALSVDGKAEIMAFQLSNGERVLDASGLSDFFAAFGGI
jgi:hypothetical protein